MPSITPKSPELIQAQIATFVAETIPSYSDRKDTLQNIGSFALADSIDEDLMADYTGYLRSVEGSRYDGIKNREEALAAYADFQPEIAELKESLAGRDDLRHHPDFIGNGSNSHVFKLEKDGRHYAVRVPGGKEVSPTVIDDHLSATGLAKGMAHMEQIVAASYQDGVTIAEVIPGKEVNDLLLDELGNTTTDQLSEFADTVIEAHARGVLIDPKPSNFLYDPEAGYGLVDYQSSKIKSDGARKQGIGEAVGMMAHVIGNGGLYTNRKVFKTEPEDYATEAALEAANLKVLQRFRDVVDSKLEGDPKQDALVWVDDAIKSAGEQVTNLTDPEYVKKRISIEKSYIEAASKKPPGLEGWDKIII